MVSLHVIIPACLLHLIAALKPSTGASSSAQPGGATQISLAHAPWTYNDHCPLHMACLRYQREVLKYVLEGGYADTDQLRSLASYDEGIELHSVGHLQSDGDTAVTNDVYISRLQCAAAPWDEVRQFPGRVFGLEQKEYDMLVKRGNHGSYSRADRDFTTPGQHLLRWAAASGRLSTVDESLKSDRWRGHPRPHKRNRT